MAILIEGMEMPINCVSCKLWVMQIIGGKGFDICRASDKVVNAPYSKPDWCPLIEVLEPHGRLIDASVAYDKIAEQEGGNYVDMDAVGIGLDETPTVIPASEEGEEGM